jgi:hypothetical protein
VIRRLGIVWSYSARGLAVGLEVLKALRETGRALRGRENEGRGRDGEGRFRTEVSEHYRRDCGTVHSPARRGWRAIEANMTEMR